MSEELSIESLSQQLVEADQAEQPETDSAPEEEAQQEEVASDDTEQPPEGEDGQPTEEPPEEKLIEWTTANGETFKATQKELQDGYLRQQDYTVKAQSLAEERRAAQTQIQQQAQLVAALSQDIGEVQTLQKQLEGFQQVDWNQLQQEDPIQANNLMTRFLLLKQTAAEAQQKLQTKAQTLQAEQANVFRMQSAEAFDHLKKLDPHFSEKTLKEMRDWGVKRGAHPDELAQLSHKVLLEAIYKANKYDQLQSTKPQVENRLKGLPPPAKPGRATAAPSKAQEITRALNLKKTFSVDEFAQLYKSTR